MAVEADVSVADLVRARASELANGTITHEELVGQVTKGRVVMEKKRKGFPRRAAVA